MTSQQSRYILTEVLSGRVRYGRVPQGGVWIMETKKNIFAYLVEILHLLLLQWQQWEYRHMGCSAMSQRASEILVEHSKSKKTPLFLGPKRCNLFF